MGRLLMLYLKRIVLRRIKQFKNKPKLALWLNKQWGSVTGVYMCDPWDSAKNNLTFSLFTDVMRADNAR